MANALPNGRADHQSSPEFQAGLKHTRRLFDDFVFAWYSAGVTATRSPGFADSSLVFRFANHVLESATAVLALTTEGMHGPLRRELRHLLEHAVKLTAVDQRLSGAPLADRLEYLSRQIPSSSIDVGDLSFWGLSAETRLRLKSTVRSDFKRLSAYVHPSREQLDTRLDAEAAGSYLGFESTGELAQVNQLVRRIYDIVLVHTFECLGPGITGDVFIQVLDERTKWSFHQTTFTSELSRFFDYKMERQARAADQSH